MREVGEYRHEFVQGLADEIKALRARLREVERQRDGAVEKAERYREQLGRFEMAAVSEPQTVRDIVEKHWLSPSDTEGMDELVEELEQREAALLWPASGEREAT